MCYEEVISEAHFFQKKKFFATYLKMKIGFNQGNYTSNICIE